MGAEADLNRVLKHIYRVTGFDARHYRPSTLERRLGWRLVRTNSRNYREYLARLKKDASENYSFIHSLLIHVSDFFRDREVFRYLEKKVLPDLLRRAASEPGKRLRVWSVACSRGQEPYSLAMILEELRQRMAIDVAISILATDVSQPILHQARKGCYSKSDVRSIPQDYRKKYLLSRSNEGFIVAEPVRRMVRFRRHDLLQDGIPGTFHLVLCRNVLIFILARGRLRLIRKIHASLKPRGILVLGQSESLEEEKRFRSLSPPYRIYERVS